MKLKALDHIEAQSTRRRRAKGGLAPFDDDETPRIDSSRNFIHFCYSILSEVKQNMETIRDVIDGLKPRPLFQMDKAKKSLNDDIAGLNNERFRDSLQKNLNKRLSSFDDMQMLMLEMQFNLPIINQFIAAMGRVDGLDEQLSRFANDCLNEFESYYNKLLNRHRTTGIKVHENALITDVALAIYDNVDKNGEIQDGTKPDEISAYSANKAKVLAQAVLTFREFVVRPLHFQSMLVEQMRALEQVAGAFTKLKSLVREFKEILGVTIPPARHYKPVNAYIEEFLLLDFSSLTYKEPDVMFTREERFNLNFQDETLSKIVNLIISKANATELVEYILNRKAELKRFFQEENSFYVCKISNGNPFGGEAPGALKVIPGPRPLADLDEIVGSGFGSIKEFLNQIETAEKWHDLFVATSPSKTGDKSNVLLIGPQGCGKSEILRAVGGDKNSIGIFAQGSDFLTCWMGEAEKNPKRLFEQGLKLQKESNRHVHFLIDEIDMVLNNDQTLSKSTNLTLEFQILMDGVVQYPHISIWGATNNPQRIPIPMIRRFHKVAIVGELTQDDRLKLLKQFCHFLPVKGFSKENWQEAAKKLEGATGDICRKVVDQIWREKMSDFVVKQPKEAEKLISQLNKAGKFEVSEFKSDERGQLVKDLTPHVQVTPEDVDRSIKEHLENFAIQKEIEVAVNTYKAAHELIENLRRKAE